MLFLFLVNKISNSIIKVFTKCKNFWFHSRAIASGRCEHGQARRPFEQVGDVFMDDDVVDDEKFFHHQATIVFTEQLHHFKTCSRSVSPVY